MRASIQIGIWVAVALVAFEATSAVAKDDAVGREAPPTEQVWTVEIGFARDADSASALGQATGLDRALDVLRSNTGVSAYFPQKSGKDAVTIRLAEPASRARVGQAYRELRSTPGVAWVKLRNKSSSNELGNVVDTRLAVGLILAPGPDAFTTGMLA